MKKRIDLFLAAFAVPIDYVMVMMGALAAYFLRYQDYVVDIRPIVFDLPLTSFFLLTIIFGGFWILIFAWFGLYTTRRTSFVQELSKIVQACTMSTMAITTYMVFIREIFSSRFIILFTWIFSILFVLIGRMLLRNLRNYLRSKGLGTYRTVIIGKNHASDILQELFFKHPHLGFKTIKVLDSTQDIFKQLQKCHKVDEIIQTDTHLSRSVSSELIDYCQRKHVIYKYVGGNFESKVTNNEVHTLAGIPIIELKRTPLDGWGKILKRILDIIGALFGIIIFFPLMVIFGFIVKVTSKGPVFADTPPRAGQYKKPFKMYKLRSMYVGAHKDQKNLASDRDGLFKMEKDPRVTTIGKFIRKTSIDELPQFFNVLMGTMSLVGPRPHFLNEYTDEQSRVLDIKPGVTGLSQISGRSDLQFEEEIKLDTYYIENWSLWLDIWIILKTPIILFTKIKSAV